MAWKEGQVVHWQAPGEHGAFCSPGHLGEAMWVAASEVTCVACLRKVIVWQGELVFVLRARLERDVEEAHMWGR